MWANLRVCAGVPVCRCAVRVAGECVPNVRHLSSLLLRALLAQFVQALVLVLDILLPPLRALVLLVGAVVRPPPLVLVLLEELVEQHQRFLHELIS